MSELKKIREKSNLTQEELSEKSKISVRTIQRIEAGTIPKGHTLKSLAKALAVNEHELMDNQRLLFDRDLIFIKLINLSSLPFVILPPANIFLPWILSSIKNELNEFTKQIITIQILWTILAVILFIPTYYMKYWFSFGTKVNMYVIGLLLLTNVFIILRNTAEIDKTGKLYYQMTFSII